ncbi:peptidylprolyl isomerase [Candidatus Sumerlaeota bacterium]|nr:peptidylprolyl isomerase [Candidatus Sumerlaeota bacterium]
MRRIISYHRIIFILFLYVSVVTAFLKAEENQEKIRTDIVAIVDHRYLRKNELKIRTDKLLAQNKSNRKDTESEQAFRRFTEGKIVKEWVNIALLAAEAEKRGLRVTDAELQEKLDQLHKEYAPNLDIESALKKAGYTRDQFLQEMRDAILGEKLVHDYITKHYSEKQIREFYNKNKALFINPPMVRVLHIFRALTGNESKKELKAIYKEMQALRKRALQGEDFRELAKESDALSRYRGGDLGWLTPANRLPAPINTLIFKYKPGEVSKVILDKKRYGYHLIKVVEKKKATGVTFEEARQDVELYLFNQVKEKLIEQLKHQHRVIINLSGIPESVAFPASRSQP